MNIVKVVFIECEKIPDEDYNLLFGNEIIDFENEHILKITKDSIKSGIECAREQTALTLKELRQIIKDNIGEDVYTKLMRGSIDMVIIV